MNLLIAYGAGILTGICIFPIGRAALKSALAKVVTWAKAHT